MEEHRHSRRLPGSIRDIEQDRLTLEGLSDVDAGRVVEHEVVRAWADSLKPHT